MNDAKGKHRNCTSLPKSSHAHGHIHSSQAQLDISGYSTARSLCTVLLYHYLLIYYKHTLESITASSQWNNMYMFTYKERKTKKCGSSICRDVGHQVFRSPLSSFCGETSFYFLKRVFKFIKPCKMHAGSLEFRWLHSIQGLVRLTRVYSDYTLNHPPVVGKEIWI